MRDPGFGVWVARSTLLNPAGVEKMISKLHEISAGRAYVQVVGRGDSQYSSRILPRAEELDGPFDGLSETIEMARGSGLKISAWMNVNLVWKFGDRPSSKEHVVNSHPEWITCDERGLSMLEYSSCDIEEVFGPFIDPGIPQVRRFTAAIADELASYDVEEVHLDFIRYPFRNFGYTQAALHEYRRWLRAANLKNTEENFDRFRIESTGEQVRLIREKVRSRGKKLSCAVFDDYSERAVKERLQPWLGWLEDGLIDSAVVMAYGREPDGVISRVENICNIHGSLKGIRVGLGAFNYAGRWDDFIGLVKRVRKMDPDEITFFALSSIDEELAGKLKALD